MDIKHRIGDFLLTFSKEQRDLPARTPDGTWQVSAQNDYWKLWSYSTTPLWKGSPCRRIQATPWQLWVVGEFYPPTQTFPTEDDLNGGIAEFHQRISNLNGRFLIWLYDARTCQWHLWTDRFGTIHAYYANNGEKTALGTYFPSVAAGATRRQLDWLGLAGFFAFGFFPEDRTYYQNVRILRPSTHYTFDENGRLLHESRYWHWWHEPDYDRSYNDTVDEYAHVFEQVMKDHLEGGRIAIPISGGLDSRSTVIPVSNFRPPTSNLWSYSYGYSDDSVETHIARQVAAARDLPFQAFTIQPYLFDKIEQVLAWTEGFQDITQPRQAFVRDKIGANADYLIAGLWGDVWHDDMGVKSLSRERGIKCEQLTAGDVVNYALHKMEKDGRAWLLEHLIQPKLGTQSMYDVLHEMVRPEMDKVSHIDDPDFRVKAFKTEQWSFRWSFPPIRVFQSAAWPRLVFYDTRLTDFFCTVPTAYVSQRRLQIDHLKRYAPDLARITWQAYDTNLYRYQHFNTWQLPKRAFKKAWRILTRKKILQRNWEVQFFSPSGRDGLFRWLLQPGLRLHEFTLPQEIQNLLDSFYQAPLEHGRGYTVSMLLTFSAWLEKYG